MDLVLAKLADAGADILATERGIAVSMEGRPRAVDLVTLPYPGFPTDLQPFAMALAAVSDGTAMITENVFEARFMFAQELARLLKRYYPSVAATWNPLPSKGWPSFWPRMRSPRIPRSTTPLSSPIVCPGLPGPWGVRRALPSTIAHRSTFSTRIHSPTRRRISNTGAMSSGSSMCIDSEESV